MRINKDQLNSFDFMLLLRLNYYDHNNKAQWHNGTTA
jgi:hypothetical protein